MHTTEEGLLRAIGDEPEEDSHRLVYADWLEENGQAERAELIRVQCALTGRVWQSEEYPVANEEHLRKREEHLLEEQGEDWLRDYPSLAGVHWEFHRGLVEQVNFD